MELSNISFLKPHIINEGVYQLAHKGFTRHELKKSPAVKALEQHRRYKQFLNKDMPPSQSNPNTKEVTSKSTKFDSKKPSSKFAATTTNNGAKRGGKHGRNLSENLSSS